MARTRKTVDQPTEIVNEETEMIDTTDTSDITTTTETEPTEQAVKPTAKDETRLCACGCGDAVSGKKSLWRQGHDARHHSALLKRHDAGDVEATTELIERRWATEAQLAARADKGETGAQRVERAKAKLIRIEEQIAALVAKRDTLVAVVEAQA